MRGCELGKACEETIVNWITRNEREKGETKERSESRASSNTATTESKTQKV